MHRQLHAQCRIDLTLEAASFLLIKGQNQTGTFFQAVDPADGVTKNCIPATSLKGVWRSAAERILRSFDASLACDPFSEQSCSKRMESKSVAPAEVYAHLCPACRLFGCTAHAGLLTIHDGWGILMEESRRTGIAIDRFTGGVKKGALYTVNPLHAKATFGVKVDIHNVEGWHLGLLTLLCREMNEGYLGLGSGTRKGMGRVKVTWNSVTLRYPVREAVLNNAQQVPGTSLADRLWTTYCIDGDNLKVWQKEWVEQSLAPMLKEKMPHSVHPPKGER